MSKPMISTQRKILVAAYLFGANSVLNFILGGLALLSSSASWKYVGLKFFLFAVYGYIFLELGQAKDANMLPMAYGMIGVGLFTSFSAIFIFLAVGDMVFLPIVLILFSIIFYIIPLVFLTSKDVKAYLKKS